MGTNPATLKALKDLLEISERLNQKPQFRDDKDFKKLHSLMHRVILYHIRRQKGLPGGHPKGIYKYDKAENEWWRDNKEKVTKL